MTLTHTHYVSQMDWSDSVHGNDYDVNAALRRDRRGDRRQRVALEQEAEQRGLGIELLPVAPEDTAAAAAMDLNHSRY